MTGRWQKRPDALMKRLGKQASSAATGRWTRRWRQIDWMRPVASDRALAVSDQLIVAPTVGTTGRVRSVAEKRDFDPNGYFLSGAYKYNPQPAK